MTWPSVGSVVLPCKLRAQQRKGWREGGKEGGIEGWTGGVKMWGSGANEGVMEFTHAAGETSAGDLESLSYCSDKTSQNYCTVCVCVSVCVGVCVTD